MREDAVQSLMYAICLGFVVACLQFTMRGGEIDKKREAIIGVKKETKLAQTAALRRVKFTVFPLEKAIMRQAKTANTKVDATTPKI